MKRHQWLATAFSVVPAVILAALVAKLFGLSFWWGLAWLCGFQLVCAAWDTVWASVWFHLVGRRTAAAEYLDALRERQYPEPDDDRVHWPLHYFSEVRDDPQQSIELRLDAAGVATVLWPGVITMQRALQLQAAWTEALIRYKRGFAIKGKA
jgi:hypothetical protein